MRKGIKLKFIISFSIILFLLFFFSFLNWKFEVIAVHPLRSSSQHGLRVLIWNVHCSEGADYEIQSEIAKLILQENADFVLLNEYNQDSCLVMDSILRTRYPFIEESQSHRICGDIFYSKKVISNSGQVYNANHGTVILPIKGTIALCEDSVLIIGIHMASNQYNVSTIENENRKDTSRYSRYKDAQVKRCCQAQWIKDEMLKHKQPVIVMGDMNDFNCSAPLDTLRSCGLIDSWWEGGFGYGATFHDGWLRLRIDHILHSKELKLESVKVIDTDLSDHNPVVAGFSLMKH